MPKSINLKRNNCILKDSVLLTVDTMPVFSLNVDDTTLCNNQSITLSVDAGYSYLWSTGETTNTVSYDTMNLGTGIHTIYVTVTNGVCQDIDSATITFENCTKITTSTKNNLSVYPNPAKNFLYITSKNLKSSNIQIMDISGKICNLNIPVQNNTIDISDLQNGMYFIKLDNQVIRFIKQ